MRMIWTGMKNIWIFLCRPNHATALATLVAILGLIFSGAAFLVQHVSGSESRDGNVSWFDALWGGKPKDPLIAAVELLSQNRDMFQVRVHQVLNLGDAYCNIQSVNIDKNSGAISIAFDHMGGTTVNLTPVSRGSRNVRGWYRINIPILGETTVTVDMTFDADGTARGEWKNLGSGGGFNIIRRN